MRSWPANCSNSVILSLPPDLPLPPLSADDPLGRGVFSSRHAKRWRTGRRERDSFLESEDKHSLSVDRLGLVTDALMTHIANAVAAGRGPGRAFYGWAVLTVRDASGNGRSVRASPDLPANPYHADIDLNIRAEVDRRDAQKQHADDLAARAQWKERPASD